MKEQPVVNLYSGSREGRAAVKTLTGYQEIADYSFERATVALRSQVSMAESLRVLQPDAVEVYLLKRASEKIQKKFESKLTELTGKGVKTAIYEENIDIAMAGFFRIGTETANFLLKRDRNHRTSSYYWHKRHFEPVDTSDTTNVVNRTIHNDPIFWHGEITTDHFKTKLRVGIDSHQSMYRLIAEAKEWIAEAKGIQEKVDKDDNDLNGVVGRISAAARMYLEVGRYQGNAAYLNDALSLLNEANRLSTKPNKTRTKDFAVIILKETPKYHIPTLLRAGFTYWMNRND